jgi:hypothetical protein
MATNDDDVEVQEFIEALDTDGIAISSVLDGVIIAVTKDKLQEFLKVANSNGEDRIIIFVKRQQAQDGFKQ